MVEFLRGFVEIAKTTWNDQYSSMDKFIFKAIGVIIFMLTLGVIIQAIAGVLS